MIDDSKADGKYDDGQEELIIAGNGMIQPHGECPACGEPKSPDDRREQPGHLRDFLHFWLELRKQIIYDRPGNYLAADPSPPWSIGRCVNTENKMVVGQARIKKKKSICASFAKSSPVECIPQPFTHGPQTLPAHRLVLVRHQLHHPRLQAQALQLHPPLRQLLDQVSHIIAPNRQYLLVIVPVLA